MTGSSEKQARSNHGIFSREDKSSTPLGTSVFIGLRLVDPLVQYGFLARGWGDPLIRLLGGKPLPLEGTTTVLGLPYWRLSLFIMAIATSAKTIFYLVHISKQAMPVRGALFVGILRLVSNSVNTLLFCTTATSAAARYVGDPAGAQPFLASAWWLFFIGLSVETTAEVQRKTFKDQPHNRNKAFTGGLFAWARHINYGGYSIWKSATATAACGYLYGAFTLAWLIGEFRRRAIPELDQYCAQRVGTPPSVCSMPD